MFATADVDYAGTPDLHVSGESATGSHASRTEIERPFGSYAISPVSYTHLDVYKRQINGAAQIAIAAGVQASAISASGSVNRALQDHLSLSNSVNQRGAPSLHREGPDLWASMLYRDSDSSGIRAGRFNADYKNDFGGIVAGADYTCCLLYTSCRRHDILFFSIPAATGDHNGWPVVDQTGGKFKRNRTEVTHFKILSDILCNE